MQTKVPGMPPIDLPAFYPEFAYYYPNCEQGTKGWFVKNVKPDWTIIDVGAHIGYYSVLFSRLTPKGKVFAIEPTETFEMLQKNVRHNKADNVACLKVAFGKSSGQIKDGIFRIWGKPAEVKTYPFMTLDEFVKAEGLERIDAIKIDVDSYDWEVLQGSMVTMKWFNPFIMVELNHALGKRNQSRAQALQWMHDQGYEKAPEVYDGENFLFKR